jgi:hypothetical protein
MAEQTFRSPGFFENEVDLTGRTRTISGTPAGIIGTAEHGPAFVPVTIGSFADFQQKFGQLSSDRLGPYAVNAWLQNRNAVTYVRVLGAGANNSTTDIITTQNKGTVKNAGFILSGSDACNSDTFGPAGVTYQHVGAVQFLVADHDIQTNEGRGHPVFSKNDSITTSNKASLVRAMIFPASGSRIELLDADAFYAAGGYTTRNNVDPSAYDGSSTEGTFKLIVSSAMGKLFSNDENKAGIKIYTASLDPSSEYYISKVLNTSPEKFHEKQHLLYGDFAVESELAKVRYESGKTSVQILSGSDEIYTLAGGDQNTSFNVLFGSLNTRYQTARTTSFISQPFGDIEYDLFHFESLDDGEIGNSRVKISISNIQRSINTRGGYPTFNVLIRKFDDSDTNLKVLEQFPNCNLNPASEDYIASKIGDLKIAYNFDAETDSERRLNITGKRPNKSRYVRIIMAAAVEDKKIPQETLPFGFKGLPSLKTNDNLTDKTGEVVKGIGAADRTRLVGITDGTETTAIKNSIVPPVPLRFKCTKGAVAASGITGKAGSLELADARYYWGIKFERVPRIADISDGALNANASAELNPLIQSYSKLLGIQKLDTLTTGSGADLFNNNKFTLAKVALNGVSNSAHTLEQAIKTEITGTAREHIENACFVRNAEVVAPKYTVAVDGASDPDRLTFASLAAASGSATTFNKFTDFLKFTNMMYGGFDGVNILDPDQKRLNDKASSVEAGGYASGGTLGYQNLSIASSPGSGEENNIINSYRVASKIITDPMASRVNVVAIPGIKEPLITDHAGDLTKDYSQAIYLMDIPSYDDDLKRLFSDSTKKPNVRNTIDKLNGRAIDNSYVATYFPDVIKKDPFNNYHVHLPSSIAAVQALGYNDAIAFPWFAPAGFNRGALEDVVNTKVRLNTEDRNILYESRINPIASFPQGGFVIFGQKTLQENRSALDRVNVRRMLLEVKRIVSDIATKFIFEQNTPALRSKFIAQVTPKLGIIQAQQGIDQFKIIMDSSNNTQEDIETNRLNGKIILVPTRAVEFIVMDFIITNSGVSFE